MDLSQHGVGIPTPVELATLKNIIQLSANRGYCWATFAAFEAMPELGPTSRSRPRTPKRDREARREKFRSAIAGLRKKGLLETVYPSPGRDRFVDPASGEGANTRYCWPTPAGLAVCADFVLRLRTARLNQGKPWPNKFGLEASGACAPPEPGGTNAWGQAFTSSTPGRRSPGGQALEHLAGTDYEQLQSTGTHKAPLARKSESEPKSRPHAPAAETLNSPEAPPPEWTSAMEAISARIPMVFFDTFIAPLRFHRALDGSIHLRAANARLSRRVAERYQDLIEQALGEPVTLLYEPSADHSAAAHDLRPQQAASCM